MQHTSIAHRRRWVAAVAASSLALVVALAAAPPAAASASGLKPMAAADAVTAMEAGTSLDHVEIQGIVHMEDATVDKPFECTGCQFDDTVFAQNAVFGRLVNLSGSIFKGSVNMTGATFGAPALFGSPSTQSSFLAGADFTLATFSDLADFERATFLGPAMFVLTRFRNDAIFAGEQSLFAGQVSFDRASFGATADFRQRLFFKSADFKRVTFSARTDFSDARFPNGAMFSWARFGTETTFLGAMLGRRAVLDNVRSAGSIDFTSTKIRGTLVVTNVAVAGLSFRNAVFNGGRLQIGDVSAPDFFIDISSLGDVQLSDSSSTDQSRREVLALLESSAKSHNDLALANDAHYRLQSLRSNDYWAPFHWLDVFFYRWIAGYLVRPDHPIFTLLALAILVSFLRVLLLVPEPPPAPEASRVRPGWHLKLRVAVDRASRTGQAILRMHAFRRLGSWLKSALWPGLKEFGHELLDTLRLIWPGSGATAKGRRFEAFAYRVLFVCMLIGFANSNPTLRQMLDALL